MDDGVAAPLDPGLAPLLLFDHTPEESDDGGASSSSRRLVYSVPKRQLLAAAGLGCLTGTGANWVTPQGWVLTLDAATRAASLRDPFSSRTVRLPPDQDGLLASSNDTRCFLSTHRPTDPGCVVLLVHFTEPVLCYCRPGDTDTRWFRHEYQPELLVVDDRYPRDSIISAMSDLTAVGGVFYTEWDDKVATLQFLQEPTLSTSQVIDEAWRTSYHFVMHDCLVESCEELFKVRFGYALLCKYKISRVEVHKLDRSRGTWVKVRGLGPRAFFISARQFGVSILANKFGLKANCIYFTDSDDKGLYIYNMEQGTTTLHNPGADIPNSMQPILLLPAA
ncbi:hypothetical protein ACP4OV_023546 [Aristida adscensionis]